MNAATFQVMEITPLFTLDTEPITDRDFSYIDYLLPGIVAMSIMQMGLFSVAFGFVQAKRLGILRRLFATPVRPANVLFAEVVTRLIVSAIQTLLLIGVAVLFFDAEVVGNMAAILAVAVVGGAVFLTMGFGIAGWAKKRERRCPAGQRDRDADDVPVRHLLHTRLPAGRAEDGNRLPAAHLSRRRPA